MMRYWSFGPNNMHLNSSRQVLLDNSNIASPNMKVEKVWSDLTMRILLFSFLQLMFIVQCIDIIFLLTFLFLSKTIHPLYFYQNEDKRATQYPVDYNKKIVEIE